jgi:hypothetical protein
MKSHIFKNRESVVIENAKLDAIPCGLSSRVAYSAANSG